VVCSSLDEAIDIARETAVDDDVHEVCVIGGTKVFEAVLPKARRLYITEVDASPEGDAWFPTFDESRFEEIENERHDAGEKDDHGFTFRILERI
jgi:dihydrofolate reductase